VRGRTRHCISPAAIGPGFDKVSGVTRRQSSLETATLVLILIGAALLRFWNLQAGIPYAVGVDEPQIVERALRMMKTGDFNPHFFDWPSLTIYLQVLTSVATFLLGSMRGLWSHLDQISAADMYLPGRAVIALLGTATVWVTYHIGRRWGAAEGLAAALLMAVIPYHVRESHYVLTDVPTAFLTTLTFLLALRAHERPTLGTFGWAGLAAGLAASGKYNGSIAILFPLIAGWLTAGTLSVRIQRTLVVCGIAGLGFLAGTPYAVLDMPAFLNDYARLATIFARERLGEPGWSIYLKHLRGALGWPALILAFAGLIIAGARAIAGPGRVRWVQLVTFTTAYFAVMAGSYQIYGRYLLPLFPMFSLMAAIATIRVVGVLRRSSWPGRVVLPAAAAVVAGLVAVPAMTAVEFDRGLGRVTTIDLAYRWIEAHVPAGSKVVIERRVLLLPEPRYASVNLPSLVGRSYEDYAAEGVDYLLSSSFEEAFASPREHRELYVAYRHLFDRAEMVASFHRSTDVDGPALAIFRIRR
jgi:4-amino-4-deoxy-L-arabinose transferase-like glycosyltransferase